MPTTIEMNITENSDRWPGKIVARPTDHARLIDSTMVMAMGLPMRLKPTSNSASVRTKDTTLAYSLSRKAAVISSLDSAGLPVTPTLTSGNSFLSRATTWRTPSMAPWLLVKVPVLVSTGAARMNSRRWSSER